jgi:TonB family protein
MVSSDVDAGPNLLMDWQRPADLRQRWLRAGIGSAIVHVVFLLAALGVGSLEAPLPPNATEIASTIRKVTPLYAPAELTQKAPNRNKVSKEVNVEGLMASAARKPTPPVPPAHAFRPPDPTKTNPEPPPTTRIAEPPKIDTAATNPIAAAPLGVPKAPPPPQIQAVEKPKLTLENPGQYNTGPRPANSKIAPPGTTVDDAVRKVARGEIEAPPRIPGSVQMEPPKLELLSDPMGVDFKPYLIRILALVRQNWFAVIPQSARLGNRGITQLQFIIDRNGQVPKLVISDTSGSETLDKAAVAGVSASVPFPPLPQEFKGREIRVQFAFKYNIK